MVRNDGLDRMIDGISRVVRMVKLIDWIRMMCDWLLGSIEL